MERYRMNGKQLYQYAVLRFMPFKETREFANFGIVLIAPKTGYFAYKLAPKRFGRITQFFRDADKCLYAHARDNIALELERLENYISHDAIRDRHLVSVFDELTRHRDSICYASEKSQVLSDETPEALLERLYDKLVARSFVTQEYREQQMAQALKKTLLGKLGRHFVEREIAAGYARFKIPLCAEQDGYLKLIKPIALNKKTALKNFEHASQWIGRFSRLFEHGEVSESNALLVCDAPTANSDKDNIAAYEDVVSKARGEGVRIAAFDDKRKILSFANQ